MIILNINCVIILLKRKTETLKHPNRKKKAKDLNRSHQGRDTIANKDINGCSTS